MVREFFVSGCKGCYQINQNLYIANEAIFFKLVHNNIANKQTKECTDNFTKAKRDVMSLQDFGI